MQNLGAALGFSTLPGPLAEKVVQGPNLKLTLPAIKQQVIPIRDFAKLSLPAYAELHTAYILQLAQCIATLQQDSASPVLHQLQTWGLECGMLLVATSFTSPRMHRDLHHCKMDAAQVVPGDLPDSLFKSLLVSVLLFFPAVIHSCACCCCASCLLQAEPGRGTASARRCASLQTWYHSPCHSCPRRSSSLLLCFAARLLP